MCRGSRFLRGSHRARLNNVTTTTTNIRRPRSTEVRSNTPANDILSGTTRCELPATAGATSNSGSTVYPVRTLSSERPNDHLKRGADAEPPERLHDTHARTWMCSRWECYDIFESNWSCSHGCNGVRAAHNAFSSPSKTYTSRKAQRTAHHRRRHNRQSLQSHLRRVPTQTSQRRASAGTASIHRKTTTASDQ